MKKLILLALTALMMVGCAETNLIKMAMMKNLVFDGLLVDACYKLLLKLKELKML